MKNRYKIIKRNLLFENELNNEINELYNDGYEITKYDIIKTNIGSKEEVRAVILFELRK